MASEKKLTGNDRDEHDCICSAGYQWSELLKDCIRPFEKGVRLNPAGNSPVNGVAYLVFNADSSEVEIFWSADAPHPLLHHQSGTDCWKSGKAECITALLVSNNQDDMGLVLCKGLKWHQ